MAVSGWSLLSDSEKSEWAPSKLLVQQGMPVQEPASNEKGAMPETEHAIAEPVEEEQVQEAHETQHSWPTAGNEAMDVNVDLN